MKSLLLLPVLLSCGDEETPSVLIELVYAQPDSFTWTCYDGEALGFFVEAVLSQDGQPLVGEPLSGESLADDVLVVLPATLDSRQLDADGCFSCAGDSLCVVASPSQVIETDDSAVARFGVVVLAPDPSPRVIELSTRSETYAFEFTAD